MKNILLTIIALFAFSCTEPIDNKSLTHNDIIGSYQAALDYKVPINFTINETGIEIDWYGPPYRSTDFQNIISLPDKYSFYVEAYSENNSMLIFEFTMSIINGTVIYHIDTKETGGPSNVSYNGVAIKVKQ